MFVSRVVLVVVLFVMAAADVYLAWMMMIRTFFVRFSAQGCV